MKTIIINIPNKDESLFTALVKKMGFESRIISDDEKAEIALAQWIKKGMETEDVSEDEILSTLKKNGAKI
jgi:hypothetical protein